MSWAEIAQSEQNRARGGSVNNFKMTSGQNYNVRFVGDPFKFSKYFINNKSAITDGDEGCIIRNKYNIDPNTKYAVHVFDRADGKPILRVAEVAYSVIKPVLAWWKARKHEPGGPNGCDFNIDVTGQKKLTRYAVTPLDITPFTEEEMEVINKEIPGGIAGSLERLKKLYKATPQSEIEGKLFGGDSNGGGTVAVRQSISAATVAPAGAGKPSGWSEPPF